MSEISLGISINLPTEFGELAFRCIEGSTANGVVVSSVKPPRLPIPVRIHSSCVIGESLLTQDCDCRSQLWHSIAYIYRHGGHVVYVYDEGRGAGLAFKFRAMKLQQRLGIDTAAAFVYLGQPPDIRDYAIATEVVAQIVGSHAVALLTNNPRKIEALEAAGVNVAERVPLVVPESQAARYYFEEKVRVLGHLPEGPTGASPSIPIPT